MKALVYHGPFDMRLEQIPVPEVAPHHLLVKMKAVGICGSDVHGFAGRTGRRAPGMVMGHEISGVIEAMGPGARQFETGQNVAVQPIIYCRECRICLTGNTSVCPNKAMIGVNMGRTGGLAEYLVVPQDNVFLLPHDLPHSLGCLAEPFAVGASVARQAEDREAQAVLIVGAGVIGLCVLLMMRERGAEKLLVVDRVPRKLELVRQFGGIPVDFSKEDPVERVLQETQGHGADISIEAVGVSASVQTAMYGTRNGGRVFWIGNSEKIIKVDMQDVVVKGKSIQGVYCYSDQDFERAIAFVDANREVASLFVEEEVGPERTAELFTQLAKGEKELLRAVVHFG